jgi:microcystin-dependent protein
VKEAAHFEKCERFCTLSYGSTIAGRASDMSFSGSGSAHPNTSTTGGSGAHNNVQPTIVLNYMIKT